MTIRIWVRKCNEFPGIHSINQMRTKLRLLLFYRFLGCSVPRAFSTLASEDASDVGHHSPFLPNHNALPRPKLQQHSLLQRGFSCTWHCIIQLELCANGIAKYSGIGNHRAFTQAFRSSDIAEGMQCVVRMS